MNPPCHRCKKTVYPMEKLSCLDKAWHKGCFTCESCNLKLTMKTYKGYDKLPYCETHYPKTKFTAVADTPENIRLAAQTKKQSTLEYHKDHREDLAKFSKVADTPAAETYKRNQINASNAHYHNKAEQRDNMEAARVKGLNQPSQPLPPPQQDIQYDPPPPRMSSSGAAPPPAAAPPTKPRYKALYDYAAADDDEISFKEGDTIIDVNVIDDGWMEGRVQSTGQFGMLPSNYVEKA